jgi:hypothetical protein
MDASKTATFIRFGGKIVELFGSIGNSWPPSFTELRKNLIVSRKTRTHH